MVRQSNNGDDTITYTPDAGFAGATDTFQYTISDGEAERYCNRYGDGERSRAPTRTMHLSQKDDSYTLQTAGTTLTVPAPGVLANDTDEEDDAAGTELNGQPS